MTATVFPGGWALVASDITRESLDEQEAVAAVVADPGSASGRVVDRTGSTAVPRGGPAL